MVSIDLNDMIPNRMAHRKGKTEQYNNNTKADTQKLRLKRVEPGPLTTQQRGGNFTTWPPRGSYF